jgi:hypothetical protein
MISRHPEAMPTCRIVCRVASLCSIRWESDGTSGRWSARDGYDQQGSAAGTGTVVAAARCQRGVAHPSSDRSPDRRNRGWSATTARFALKMDVVSPDVRSRIMASIRHRDTSPRAAGEAGAASGGATIPAARFLATWKAGPGLLIPQACGVCAWLLLARMPAMSGRPKAGPLKPSVLDWQACPQSGAR